MTSIRLLGTLSLLVFTACASTPKTQGDATVAYPGGARLRLVADGTAVLRLMNTGPGTAVIREQYGEGTPVRSRNFTPGTRLLRRFDGEAVIRFFGVEGSPCRIVYEMEGNGSMALMSRP